MPRASFSIARMSSPLPYRPNTGGIAPPDDVTCHGCARWKVVADDVILARVN
jgi:hypothetical protein